MIVHGHSGSVTLDALRWLRDIGASFVHIDHDGEVLATSAPEGTADPRLLRAQVLAVENGQGMELVRELLFRKIEGQYFTLERLDAPDETRDRFEGYLEDTKAASTIKDLKTAETQAGRHYWDAWEGLEVRFSKSALRKIPEHWTVYRQRKSPLGAKRNRNAVDPVNVMLNQLYGILEAETRLVVMTVGLDPYLGLLHSDRRWRNSLALDVMEPARPIVDNHVLDLVAERTFEYEDFFETREGVCRVLPPLAHELSATAEKWRQAVGTVAENLARALLLKKGAQGSGSTLAPEWRRGGGPKPRPVATKVPGENRRKGKVPGQEAFPTGTGIDELSEMPFSLNDLLRIRKESRNAG